MISMRFFYWPRKDNSVDYETELKESFRKTLDAIPTMPLYDTLKAILHLLNSLPDEYYPPALAFQIMRHINKLEESEVVRNDVKTNI